MQDNWQGEHKDKTIRKRTRDSEDVTTPLTIQE